MKNTFKAISASLALMTLMSGCAASGGAQQTAAATDSAQTETTPQAEVTTDLYSGITAKNWEGRKFNFLVRINEAQKFYTETQTGDVLSDSIYKANRDVEERFGVKVNPHKIDGDWSKRAEYINTIVGSVMANDKAYDLIDGYAAIIGDAFSSKVFMNLLKVPELRLEEKWWSENVKEALTVNGKLYAMTGDLAISMWGNLQVMFFNKTMMKQLNLEYPYKTVEDGGWTLAAMLGCVKNASKDLNGDGKLNGADDQFGLLAGDDLATDNLRVAFGASVSKIGADGFPALDPVNAKMVSVYEKIEDLLYKHPEVCSYGLYSGQLPANTTAAFGEGRFMFYIRTLEQSILLRDSELDFGILPPPKFDEKQESYYTTSRDGRTMFVIPIDADADFSGSVTEALCVTFSEHVIPAYYEKTLKGKMLRDDESSEMLDIIRDSFTLDFVGEYAIQAGYAGQIVRRATHSTDGIMSYYEANRSSWEKQFESFLKAYKD